MPLPRRVRPWPSRPGGGGGGCGCAGRAGAGGSGPGRGGRMSAALYVLSTLGGYLLTSAVLLKCPALLHRPKRQRFRCRHISHRGGETRPDPTRAGPAGCLCPSSSSVPPCINLLVLNSPPMHLFVLYLPPPACTCLFLIPPHAPVCPQFTPPPRIQPFILVLPPPPPHAPLHPQFAPLPRTHPFALSLLPAHTRAAETCALLRARRPLTLRPHPAFGSHQPIRVGFGADGPRAGRWESWFL